MPQNQTSTFLCNIWHDFVFCDWQKKLSELFFSRNLNCQFSPNFSWSRLFGNTPYWNLRVHKAPCEKDFFGQDWQAVNSRCLLLCLPKYEKWGQIGQTCVLERKKNSRETERKKVAKAKTKKKVKKKKKHLFHIMQTAWAQLRSE